MASVDIINIYDEMKRDRFSYCRLCLRSSKEQRLVEPFYTLKFLDVLNVCYPRFKSDLVVCYICEALAHRACDFERRVARALQLHKLFQKINDKPELRGSLKEHLAGTRTFADGGVIVKTAVKLNRQMREEHTRSQLQQTELLLIDTTCAAEVPSPLPPPPQEELVTVILDDDDEVTKAPPAQPPGSDGQLEKIVNYPIQLQFATQDLLTKNIILHPVVTVPGNGTKFYTPTLNVSNVQSERTHNITIINNKSPDQSKMLKNSRRNSPVAKRNKGNAKKKSLVDKISTSNCGSDDSGDDPIILNRPVGRGLRAPVRVSGTAVDARAVRADRIDWEEKIPMDVISFTDASDPDPPQLLPIISDVRSVPPAPAPPDVVDLC